MNTRFAGLLLSIALTAPIAATAQTVVGRSVVDGKVALLFDNGTWSYDAGASAEGACKAITPAVQFCGQGAGWSDAPPATAEINAAFRIDARHYAQYLIEDLGTEDGLTADFMRSVVLSNAKTSTGQEAEIIDVRPATLGTLTGETIVFRVKMNGVDFVFANAIFLERIG